ncbi:DHHC palmitoyltransferase-domain-containing protein [Ochromonadaceae sp. CCMP2298]|nr:DHHC palmitoyltransferase-domain-containing protein [Ochromonadaceae sp. CCMP2298]
MSESESTLLLAGPSEGGFLDVGQMYFFNPKHHFSTLVLFRAQSRKEAEVIIKRRAVLVVVKRSGTWRSVYCMGFNGWINISDDQRGSGVFTQTQSIRRFEDWRGNNYFFAGGQLMLGCDAKYFYVTQICYVIFSLLFYLDVVPYCPAPSLIATAAALLLAYSLTNLWLTGFIEPGIIPRRPLHLTAAVPAGESPEGWRYCTPCNVMAPPRSKHCNACQNCVLDFDHHCPYTSTCVGRRNRRYFVRFILSLTALVGLIFGSCVLLLVGVARHSSCQEAVQQHTAAFLLGLTSLIALIILLPFCQYHVHIVAIGQTTFEKMRKKYTAQRNPHDRGLFRNYSKLCFAPTPASLVGRQWEAVSRDQYLAENVDRQRFEALFYSRYGTADPGTYMYIYVY